MKININKSNALSSFFSITSHVAWQYERTNELVYVYDIKNKKYYYFVDTAKDIWNFMMEHLTLKRIIEKFREIYDITLEEARNDIVEYIREIVKEKIVYDETGFF